MKYRILKFIAEYKYIIFPAVCLLLCGAIILTVVSLGSNDDLTAEANSSVAAVSSEPAVTSATTTSAIENSSEAPVSSALKESSSSKKTSSKAPQSSVNVPTASGSYNPNTNLNIEDNVFMDSLIYTGYNMEKHRADGKMWEYVLAKYKRGYGWLSNITYAGGSSGYETKNGKPDIGFFERNGFVCASFATYVYFNYLPNVAGIDTSPLPRPEDSRLADSWYKAVQKWVKLGYSEEIKFKASIDSSRYIVFRPEKEIPIGSIIIFRPHSSTAKRGSHVVVYAGYKNGNHWVYHVGTKNGPEMCAVERMLYGPEPQWPLMVVTTPSNIRFAAALELELKDDAGAPISGAEFTIKSKSGSVIKLGKTDKNGKITKSNLNYGEYTLVQTTVPTAYSATTAQTKITLNTANNSLNKVKLTNTRIKSSESSDESHVQSDEDESDD